MRRPIGALMVLLLVTIPLIGGAAGVADAADLCLEIAAFDLVLQEVVGGKDGKNANKDLGKPNKCQVFSGFFTSGLGFTGLLVTGSLCTNSTGSRVSLVANLFSGGITGYFDLPIPTAGGSMTVALFDGTTTQFPMSVAVCVPPSVPIP